MLLRSGRRSAEAIWRAVSRSPVPEVSQDLLGAKCTPQTLDRILSTFGSSSSSTRECWQGFATSAGKSRRRPKSSGSVPMLDPGGDLSPEQRKKREALQEALAGIRKIYGDEAILPGAGPSVSKNIAAVSTGSLALDAALQIGGLPRGRVVEIYGAESSGKTTLALHVIAEAQKQGGICAFVDAENTLHPDHAAAIGVNVDDLNVVFPDDGEMALNVMDHLIRSNAVDVICLDSVAALVTRAELQGELGESQVAQLARLMSNSLKRLTSSLQRSNTLVIFTNQVRHAITGGNMFGPKEITAGGNALKYYTSVRLNVRRKSTLRDKNEKATGIMVGVRVAKSKISAPFREVEFELEFRENQGAVMSREGELIDLGEKAGLIRRAGAWYSYEGQNIAQGREKAKEYLRENKELADKLTEALRLYLRPKVASESRKLDPDAVDSFPEEDDVEFSDDEPLTAES